MLKIVWVLFWGLSVLLTENPPTECGDKSCVKRESTYFVENGWLKYSVRVKEGKEELYCQVIHGTANRVNLKVHQITSSGQELIYELRSHEELDEVVVWEGNHAGKEEKTSRVPRKEFNQVGSWDIKCQKGLNGCLFGSYWRSWVNEDWKSLKTHSRAQSNQVTWLNGSRIRHFQFLPVGETPAENLFKKENE